MKKQRYTILSRGGRFSTLKDWIASVISINFTSQAMTIYRIYLHLCIINFRPTITFTISFRWIPGNSFYLFVHRNNIYKEIYKLRVLDVVYLTLPSRYWLVS